MKPPVGIIVGSNRRASINRRLAKALANLVSERLDLLNHPDLRRVYLGGGPAREAS